MPFWRTLWVVAARRDQSGARHEHSGPRHNTLVYGLLEPNVRVSGPFTAEVADRSYAGHEHGTRMYRGAGDAFAVGLEKYLVRPGRLVVRVEQQVTMPVDEARQERRTTEHDLGPTGRRR